MRRLYQIFEPLRIRMTPKLGTDGNRIVYPIRGMVQHVRTRSGRIDGRTVGYVAALLASTLLIATALLAAGYTLEDPITVLVLAAAAALAERGNVQLSTSTEQSISLVPTLFAAVLFGPLAAGLVGAASMLGEPELFSARDPERAPRLKWATYTCARFIGGVATGLAATAVLGFLSTDFGGLVAASLVAAAVGELVNLFFVASTARVRGYRLREVGIFTPLLRSSP
jgi:hypothetical protein